MSARLARTADGWWAVTPAGLVRLGTQQRNRIHAVVADFGYDRSGSYLSGPGRG